MVLVKHIFNGIKVSGDNIENVLLTIIYNYTIWIGTVLDEYTGVTNLSDIIVDYVVVFYQYGARYYVRNKSPDNRRRFVKCSPDTTSNNLEMEYISKDKCTFGKNLMDHFYRQYFWDNSCFSIICFYDITKNHYMHPHKTPKEAIIGVQLKYKEVGSYTEFSFSDMGKMGKATKSIMKLLNIDYEVKSYKMVCDAYMGGYINCKFIS